MANLQIVPAGTIGSNNNVEAQFVEMMVPLYSHGCERKIKKALSHFKGIYSVNVDFNQQKVTVWGICNKNDVLSTVRSKRKDARFWNPQDNATALGGGGIEEEQSQTPPIQRRLSAPPLALLRVRSLSWKLTLKKAFTRTYSF
ncbi:PREDICTED: heavy metal-associated isoprenylated plant protein 28 [Ipomoea nil]|uniref:heavy metal-associated isoprenylated plant protein 28 n=1 Tax=Ipomoea nil TaxID=35883 RepID=UPI000901F873|nr:PREDICTED: heavy metal-associated isoprenylated plant protein 28 [Ipomoea nil]